EIEGAELALDEVKGDAGSPAERLHHGRKIAVGKRFEIAIIEPAVLARRLVERGDCIFESREIVAPLHPNAAGILELAANILAGRRRKACEVAFDVSEGQVKKGDRKARPPRPAEPRDGRAEGGFVCGRDILDGDEACALTARMRLEAGQERRKRRALLARAEVGREAEMAALRIR